MYILKSILLLYDFAVWSHILRKYSFINLLYVYISFIGAFISYINLRNLLLNHIKIIKLYLIFAN